MVPVRNRRPMWVLAIALVCTTRVCVCTERIIQDQLSRQRDLVEPVTPLAPTLEDILQRQDKEMMQRANIVEGGFTQEMTAIGVMDRKVMRCMYDRVFRPNMRECEEAFQMLVHHIEQCDHTTFKHGSMNAVCHGRRFLMSSIQQRCVDSDFVVLEPRVCSFVRNLTLLKARMCLEEEQTTTGVMSQWTFPGSGLRSISCEDNRHYAMQLEELLCRDSKFFDRNARICDEVHRQLRMQMEKCQRKMYYIHHQKPCEDTHYFLIRQQHKCVVDRAFRIQSSQICAEHQKDTILLQQSCMTEQPLQMNELSRESLQKHICEDNMHYFVQLEQEKCMNQQERFRQQPQECRNVITKAMKLLSRCDEPLYHGQHLLACDMQRLSVQDQQEKCNDQTFRNQHLPACEVQRELTLVQLEMCNNDRFYNSHIETCNDNEHQYVQQKTQECAENMFHQQEPEKCKIILRVITPRLLEKCDDVAYYLVHRLACESLRYETEKLQNACCDMETNFFNTHERVCKDRMAASMELQQRCLSSGAFARDHIRTCQDTQRLVQLQQQKMDTFDAQSYIQINPLPEMSTTKSMVISSDPSALASAPILGRFTIPRTEILSPSSVVDPLLMHGGEVLKKGNFLVRPITLPGVSGTTSSVEEMAPLFGLEGMENRLRIMQELRTLDESMEIERLTPQNSQIQIMTNHEMEPLFRRNDIQRLQELMLPQTALQGCCSNRLEQIVRLMDLESFLTRVGDLRRMGDIRRMRLALELGTSASRNLMMNLPSRNVEEMLMQNNMLLPEDLQQHFGGMNLFPERFGVSVPLPISSRFGREDMEENIPMSPSFLPFNMSRRQQHESIFGHRFGGEGEIESSLLDRQLLEKQLLEKQLLQQKLENEISSPSLIRSIIGRRNMSSPNALLSRLINNSQNRMVFPLSENSQQLQLHQLQMQQPLHQLQMQQPLQQLQLQQPLQELQMQQPLHMHQLQNQHLQEQLQQPLPEIFNRVPLTPREVEDAMITQRMMNTATNMNRQTPSVEDEMNLIRQMPSTMQQMTQNTQTTGNMMRKAMNQVDL